MRNQKLFWLTTSLILLSIPLFAGGPLNLNPSDPDGVERWPGGGAGIPFNTDFGGLGPLTNGDAITMVLDSLVAWTVVPTASNTYSNDGPIGFDVDSTNFAPFISNLFSGTNVSDGLSPVVFDEDGSIFAMLGFGPGVLGFASPDTFLPDGTPIEAGCFLNGGSILAGFPVADFEGVTVHEFGHYSGLAHTVVNGQNIALGDTSGPTPFNTYGDAPADQVETMYPFAIIGGGQVTPQADDIGILSFLYPEPGFFAGSGTISGTILGPNEITRLTGVNVIARNTSDSFVDAVSAISGDRGETGEYTINGLTPGADYELFVDTILAGGFSTPRLVPLPGPEEFYNGPDESNGTSFPDPPDDAVAITPAAGVPETGIDIIFNNLFAPGDPLPVGDDGFQQVFLPFEHTLCGQKFSSVFVNANGNLSFCAGSTDFTESAPEMLSGPPRIAGVWDDLSPFNLITGAPQGSVFFTQDKKKFLTVHWEDVPEFANSGANTFSITLENKKIKVEYDDVSALDGLAGVSCGGLYGSGFEPEVDLTMLASSKKKPKKIKLNDEAAVYELFSSLDNDLPMMMLEFDSDKGFKDKFEKNDSIDKAKKIKLPFNSVNTKQDYTEILPLGDDVDYFELGKLKAGHTLVAETLTGQLDSILGLFLLEGKGKKTTGTLIDFDDDGGILPLSRLVVELPEDGDYALAVSTFPDFDFSGDGNSIGRYVLDVFTLDGVLLSLPDDGFAEVALDFDFPFNGFTYDSVFVNSNGSLTFGAGDADFSESVGEFLGGPPRIAGLWDDLTPSNGGLVSAAKDTNSLTVSFVDVPEFITTGANTFAITLHSDGEIDIDYGSVTALDGLVGITEGGGAADPGATDISAAGALPASGTTYELFTLANLFDLIMGSLQFFP